MPEKDHPVIVPNANSLPRPSDRSLGDLWKGLRNKLKLSSSPPNPNIPAKQESISDEQQSSVFFEPDTAALIRQVIDPDLTEQFDEQGWEERTMGRFAPGARVRKTVVDTRTDIEHGEKTWTTGQTVRDILQNHLDAGTQVYFNQIVRAIMDVDQLVKKPLSELEQQRFDNVSYKLFLFAKYNHHLSDQSKLEFIEDLSSQVYRLPIKTDFFDGTMLSPAKIEATLENIKEELPTVSYQIIDQTGKKIWIEREHLIEDRFKDVDIQAVKIEDRGGGFDAKLTELYKSTKTGKKHLRGKFGEGTKMSEASIVRNGGIMLMRSSYPIEEGQRQRIWQQRTYRSDHNTVELKGVEVDQPISENTQTGSTTIIDLTHARPEFRNDFIANIDPRGSGLARNCTDYADVMIFPNLHLEKNIMAHTVVAPVGVSTNTGNGDMYVQGLRIEGELNSWSKPVFSYNFLDSSVLKGRDRNELSPTISRQIGAMWRGVDNAQLLTDLITKMCFESHSSTTPESNALGSLCVPVNQPVAKRAHELTLDLIPQVLDINEGDKVVFVRGHEQRDSRNKALLENIKRKGYKIVINNYHFQPEALDTLRAHHGNSFEVANLDHIRDITSNLSESIPETSERVQMAKELFDQALTGVNALITASGIPGTLAHLEGKPVFLEVTDPQKEQGLELIFDPTTKGFRLAMRPDLINVSLNGEDGKEYWKKKIQIELFAAVGRTEAYDSFNSKYIAAQQTIQKVLDQAIQHNPQLAPLLNVEMNYSLSDPKETADPGSVIERLHNLDSEMLGWHLYNQSRNFLISVEQFTALGEQVNQLTSSQKPQVKDALDSRVLVKNGIAYFYEKEGYLDQEKFVLRQSPLASLPVYETPEGKVLYRAGSTKLFTPYEVPENAVIKFGSKERVVFYKGKVLRFNGADKKMKIYSRNIYDLINFDQGVIVSRLNPHGMDPESDRIKAIGKLMDEEIAKIEVTASQSAGPAEMRVTQGEIESPLTTEYGQNEWDNPIRVFQDMVQNHLDPSPDGKAILLYQVTREGQLGWVDQAGLLESDQISGFSIRDYGDGYAPDHIGTMGRTSKKSPLFAGKYGEGQKMVATAAMRNGMSLTYSSFGTKNGEMLKWRATTATKNEPYFDQGERKITQRVIFNVDSQSLDDQERVSSTTIRLGEGQPPAIWDEWVKIIDPRQKNEAGLGGLARYVINLRDIDPTKVIDMGYMRILLDEPGAVYENGLLIERKEDSLAFGYDVPEIVTTRERNSFDNSRLSGYISHALLECEDPRLVEGVIKKIKNEYLAELVRPSSGNSAYIPKVDINLGRSFTRESFVPSHPFWDAYYLRELSGYFVHSETALRRQLESAIQNISNGSGEYRDDVKKIERLSTIMANVAHLPTERLLNVDEDDFREWGLVLPTVEEYVNSLAGKEIVVNESTQRQLGETISSIAIAMKDSLVSISDNPENALMFRALASGKAPKAIGEEESRIWPYVWGKQVDRWILNTYSQNRAVERGERTLFVAPQTAGYLGSMDTSQMGLNELLLQNGKQVELVGTTIHELIHKATGFSDYTPEFLSVLLSFAEHYALPKVA